MLRFLTAGETHGKCLVAILEGMCSNLYIDEEKQQWVIPKGVFAKKIENSTIYDYSDILTEHICLEPVHPMIICRF